MKYFLRINILLVFVLILQFAIAQERPKEWATPINELSLKNVYQIDTGVYRSGQPSCKNFKELEEFGIEEVINLRYWNTDKKEARGTNIKLHDVRMNAHHIKDNDIIKALEIIKNRQGSILFHCWHGSDRTGLICAMYRIVFQDWTKEEAIKELKEGGYGYHSIYSNIPKYIEKVDIDKVKTILNKN